MGSTLMLVRGSVEGAGVRCAGMASDSVQDVARSAADQRSTRSPIPLYTEYGVQFTMAALGVVGQVVFRSDVCSLE